MPLKDRGFTLIEVAILLVIVGLISVGGLNIIGSVADSGKGTVTLKNMALVEKALQSYVVQFGCLPCPADGALASTVTPDNEFGRSLAGGAVVATDCTAAACQSVDAVVPWRTLGMAEEQATDGWNNRIRYYVGAGTPCSAAAGLQDSNGMVRCDTADYPAGNIIVVDNDGNFANTTNAAYVIVSSGPDQSLARKFQTGADTGNRYGQTSGGQFENSDGDDTFSYGDFIGIEDDTHFDDIVRYKTAPVMVQLCGPGACGNPS